MATDNLNQEVQPNKLFDVATDIEEIQSFLRISQEIAIDQLCECILDNEESVARTMDRLFFLLRQWPDKLTQLNLLPGRIMEIYRSSKQDVD